MNIDMKYTKIVDIVKGKLTCSAHNLDHVFRVYNLCMLIAKHEEKVNLEVLVPAALLHDIARVEESTDKTGEIDHAVLGSEMSEAILKELEYPEDKIEKIKHCIITHRFRTGNEPNTIEAKILFDSDKLDAIGASGIARTFMLAGQFGQSLSEQEAMAEYIQDNTAQNGRIKDVSRHTPFIEYEVKFKKVPNKLYTDKGKEIGRERLKFMDEYFNRLKLEMLGMK